MDNVNTIGFPNLGIGPFEVDKVAFTVGESFNVYWYAIIITCGLILAIVFAMLNAKRVGLTSDDVIDVALFGTPLSLLGARLYYIIFSLDSYMTDGKLDFAAMVDVRNGGLAIYGGIIFGFITTYFVFRFKRKNFLAMFDLGAFGFMIGQAIGRWGNFVNAEAYGTETSLPWGMSINGATAVHPTFLYESLWNIIGFVLLYIFARKLQKERGEIFFLYFTWYGVGRALIEGLRTDSLWLFTDNFAMNSLGGFNVRISQALGILFAVIGIVLFILTRLGKLRRIAEPKPKKVKVTAGGEEAQADTDDYKPLFTDIKEEAAADVIINNDADESEAADNEMPEEAADENKPEENDGSNS